MTEPNSFTRRLRPAQNEDSAMLEFVSCYGGSITIGEMSIPDVKAVRVTGSHGVSVTMNKVHSSVPPPSRRGRALRADPGAHRMRLARIEKRLHANNVTQKQIELVAILARIGFTLRSVLGVVLKPGSRIVEIEELFLYLFGVKQLPLDVSERKENMADENKRPPLVEFNDSPNSEASFGEYNTSQQAVRAHFSPNTKVRFDKVNAPHLLIELQRLGVSKEQVEKIVEETKRGTNLGAAIAKFLSVGADVTQIASLIVQLVDI